MIPSDAKAPKFSSKYVVFFYSAILLVNCIVFFPSFSHVARVDHVGYLIETAEIKKLPDLVAYSYSYPRHRVFAAGDKTLFRPVLFTFVSFEKWLFGYNFLLWQVTGFILHLLVLLQLYRLLKLIQFHPLIYLFILNFSVLFLCQDMVIWSCISGYLLFLIFFLQGFYYVLKYLRNEDNEKNLGLMVAFLTLSCFIFELGVIACSILLIYLILHDLFPEETSGIPAHKRILSSKAWLLLIPIVSYVSVSLNDYFSRNLSLNIQSTASNSTHFLGNISHMIWDLFRSFAFPALTTITFDDKLILLPISIENLPRSSPSFYFWGICNAALLVLLLTLGFFLIKSIRLHKTRPHKAGRISLLFFFSYIALLGVGRSADYLSQNLYHYYFLALFFTIFTYCFCIEQLNKTKPHPFPLEKLLVLILVLSTLLNGYKTYQMNVLIKNCDAEWGIYIKKLEHFVKQHENEENFSFMVLQSSESRVEKVALGAPTDNRILVSQDFMVLFPKYINQETPKYFLIYNKRDGIEAFTDRETATAYLTTKPQ